MSEADRVFAKVMGKVGWRVEYLVLYKKPVKFRGKKIVACVSDGFREVKVSHEEFELIGERLLREAKRLIWGKEEYRAKLYAEIMERYLKKGLGAKIP